MKNDVCFQTLRDMAAMLRRRELSPVELTRIVLDRIERLNPKLHAYITVTAESALEAARIAERELHRGDDRGLLHGVPIAVKDLCFTKGVRTTCASKVLHDWIPDHDATVVEKLTGAGAVLLGKLNLTEFALNGYSPGLPIPLNPWDVALAPGGSSSGSGVATAAGLCFASLGTDTGGSIRNPSAWCGVVGLKPTYGRVSRYGVFPLGMTLDHVGPMTRSVADAAIVLDAIAGRDPRDASTLDTAPLRCTAALDRGCRGLRVGVDEAFMREGARPEVVAAIDAALAVLRKEGAKIVEVEIPSVDALLESWFVICASEALVAHEATYPSRAEEYGPSMRSFLEYGATLAGRDYARAHLLRLDFARSFQAVFANADVVALPGAFMQPPPAAAMDPYGPVGPAAAPFVRFTAPFDLSGNPTLSIPVGFDDSGPHGVQFIGPLAGEEVLCQAGAAYERATEWHLRHPVLD